MIRTEPRLSLYTIDPKYCDFLRKTDRCIVYNSGRKATRPFIGILLTITKDKSQKFNYFAPLSSPKPKHLTIQDNVDLVKINEGKEGVINLNNMFPVPKECLSLIDPRVKDEDSDEARKYKLLLTNQLEWCNTPENTHLILTKAKILYWKIVRGNAKARLVARCCNFIEDEKACARYCELHGYSLT